MNLVREPDTGNPSVRFDERRLETEPRRGVRHRHCESRRQQLPPFAYRHRASRRLYNCAFRREHYDTFIFVSSDVRAIDFFEIGKSICKQLSVHEGAGVFLFSKNFN